MVWEWDVDLEGPLHISELNSAIAFLSKQQPWRAQALVAPIIGFFFGSFLLLPGVPLTPIYVFIHYKLDNKVKRAEQDKVMPIVVEPPAEHKAGTKTAWFDLIEHCGSRWVWLMLLQNLIE